MSGHRVVGVATSILLHGLVVLAVAAVIPRADLLPPLFIDLTEMASADEPVRSGRAGLALASARPGRPPAAANQHTRSRTEPAPPRPPVEAAEPPPREAAPAREPAPLRDAAPPADATPPSVVFTPAPVPVEVTPSLLPTSPTPRPSPSSEPAAGDSPGLLAAAPTRDAGANGRAGDARIDPRPRDDAGVALSGRTGREVALNVPGTGGGAGDDEGYARYGKLLQRRIQEALRYPLEARRRALAGRVKLGLTVLPNGAISSVSIVESSSHSILDEAAVETVRTLRPQPFPSHLPPRRLTFELPVSFHLE